MSSRIHLPNFPWPDRKRSQQNPHGIPADARAVPSKLTRVQIEALVSGDFVPLRLGPELVRRLNHAWSGTGQRLHMLHVEVVNTPVRCPRCGDRALYRTERRGFLQMKLLPIFGIFPWNCVSCRKSTLLRLRSADEVDTTVFPQTDHEHTHKAA